MYDIARSLTKDLQDWFGCSEAMVFGKKKPDRDRHNQVTLFWMAITLVINNKERPHLEQKKYFETEAMHSF